MILQRRGVGRGPSPVLVGIFVVVGFLGVSTALAIRLDRRNAQPRRDELVRLIESRRKQVDRLGQEATDIRRRTSVLEARRSTTASATVEQRDRVRTAAGLAPVRGAGITVDLDDSDLASQDPVRRRALRILDVDLQLVTNALWKAGGRAIAIDDQRIVSTTSIRGAGETITVNFQPLAPPYHVVAIGASAEAFRRSEVARRLESWADLFGFGFSIHEARHLEAPAFAGSTHMVAARPTRDEVP